MFCFCFAVVVVNIISSTYQFDEKRNFKKKKKHFMVPEHGNLKNTTVFLYFV